MTDPIPTAETAFSRPFIKRICRHPEHFIFTLALSFLLLIEPLSAQSNCGIDTADIVAKASSATVHVEESFQYESQHDSRSPEIPFNNLNTSPKHGSGFLISGDGYILTNKHIIKDIDVILVTLNNNVEFTAEVTAVDPDADLAILKIPGEDFPFLQLGDSDKIRQGDSIIAVGCPFKSGSIATSGIISSIGKQSSSSLFRTNYILTDASITPGNSGGPLINMQGEVIGITSAMFSNTGSIGNLSFALAINRVRKSTTLEKFLNPPQ